MPTSCVGGCSIASANWDIYPSSLGRRPADVQVGAVDIRVADIQAVAYRADDTMAA
jgi:hypothetical protein